MIKVNPKTCATCKYRMGFGGQPGPTQRKTCVNSNIACNYLGITGHSRCFIDGKLVVDPAYCDKYEKGKSVTKLSEVFAITHAETDELSRYKAERIFAERKGQKNV